MNWSWTETDLNELASQLSLRIKKKTESRRGISYWYTFESDTTPDISVLIENRVIQEVLILLCWEDANSDRHRDSEIKETRGRFLELFDNMVIQAKQVLGEPDFLGGPDESEFPEDRQNADLIASWYCRNSRILIEFGQENIESPIEISLVVVPN